MLQLFSSEIFLQFFSNHLKWSEKCYIINLWLHTLLKDYALKSGKDCYIMLNENVTITICGKSYRLRTNDSKQLAATAAQVEKMITSYCAANEDLDKYDAAVFAALDCFDEISGLKSRCEEYGRQVSQYEKNESAAAAAVEENKALRTENDSLKKDSRQLTSLQKRFSELEGKNEQLAQTLKDANEKVQQLESVSKERDEAAKRNDTLEAKNAQLTVAAKESSAKLDEQRKRIAELEKQVASLREDASKAVTTAQENKRLADKLEKAQNFEEAYRREQGRAERSEKELSAARAASQQLAKENAALKERADSLEKKLEAVSDNKKTSNQLIGDYNEIVNDYNELVEAYERLELVSKQIEQSYAELCRSGGHTASDQPAQSLEGLQAELGEMRSRLDEAAEKITEQAKEIRTLKKTNSSLDKQIKEMLEDGQLTL